MQNCEEKKRIAAVFETIDKHLLKLVLEEYKVQTSANL
jgi:hypothetical protein